MQDERRRAPRVNVDIPARWEGVLTQQQAQITSLSVSGCFVLSGGKVEPMRVERLEILLLNQEPMYLFFVKEKTAYEIGFAVRFTATDDADEERLSKFIEGELSKGDS